MHERFLVLFFGDLGDTLLAVPALRALRSTYPHARITLLTKPLPGSIASSLGLVDSVIEVDKHVFDRPASVLNPRTWPGLFRLYLRIRRERATSAILLHHLVTRWGTMKYAVLMLASGAAVRAGLDNGRGVFLTRRVRDRGFGARHEAEYCLDVASLVGAHGGVTLEAPVTDADREWAATVLAPVDSARSLIAVHPGAGWYGPGRRWSPSHFVSAARLIGRVLPATFVVVGTEAERGEANEVLAHLGPETIDLVGKTSVGQLAAVLERCRTVIGNDAGVGHLAAAAGTPAVTVFGPSNEAAWRPLLGTVVTADIACRPCFYRDFERGLPDGCASRECLALVTPRMVAEAVLDVIGREKIAV
jgi:ADP-heptose:LPS heptosyltransferase